MNVLAIGNSFSMDAMRYLSQIARAQGENLTAINLFIGGCPLERHFRHMHSGAPYSLQCNGSDTGFLVTMDEALLSRPWDVITLQQASHFSGKKEAYDPYTQALVSYIRDLCPKAMLYIHEKTVEAFAQRMELPVVQNRCPVDKRTKREEIKKLVYDLSAQYPDLKERIFGAMQRLPLTEWEPQGRYKRPKDV